MVEHGIARQAGAGWALAAALLLTACGGGEEAAKDAPAAAPIAPHDPATRLTVSMREIADLKPIAGRRVTADETQARARVGGTLVRLLVAEGEMVAAGQVIALVDEPRMDAEIAAREAGAAASRAGADVGASGLVAARAELERARALAAQAPAGLEQARAAQARAVADHDRTRSLFEQGVYAQARLDQMLAARRMADAQTRAAEAAMGAARQGVAAAEAQVAVAAAQARAARSQADAAAATTRIARAMRAEGRVLAPRAGKVTRVPVTQGAVVMPGEAIATIAAGAPVVTLMAPESDARALRVGQRLDLTDENGAVTGQAAIVTLHPAVTRGLVEIDLAGDGVESGFLGERVTVLASVGRRLGVVVPATHVRARAGLVYARLLRDGVAIDTPVQLGARRPDGVEIQSGLQAGDVIVAWPRDPATAR